MSLFEIVRKEDIVPEGLAANARELAPLDLFGSLAETYLPWPMFFDYDLDADRLIEAAKALCLKYPVLCERLKPDPDRRYSVELDPETVKIPFSELKSEITIAGAILEHSRLQDSRGEYPFHIELPFYTETLDHEAILKGEAPLAKIRLTHLKDGCVLNVTVSHVLADADRIVELYQDLGRAYLGKEISERNFDRSWLWPDQLVKHYPFLGEDVAQLPRKASPKREQAGFPNFPGDSSRMELIYFPKETLAAMKVSVQQTLSEGEFVSTNDVLLGFMWMLASELQATEDLDHNSTGLKISNTFATTSLDLLKNGVDFVPSNAFGNAIVFLPLATAGMELDELPRDQILAALATLMRKSVAAFREQPAAAAQTILLIYNIISTGEFPFSQPLLFLTSNYTKTPTEGVDFGCGPPKMTHFIPPMPYLGNQVVVAPAPGGDEGIILHFALVESRYERLKKSQVMKELAPGAKLLYSDVTHEEFNAMLQS